MKECVLIRMERVRDFFAHVDWMGGLGPKNKVDSV